MWPDAPRGVAGGRVALDAREVLGNPGRGRSVLETTVGMASVASPRATAPGETADAVPRQAGPGLAAAAIILAAMATFLIGHRLAPFAGLSAMGPIGVALAVAGASGVVAAAGRRDGMGGGACLAGVVIGVLAGFAGLGLAEVVRPMSWDGQTYHLPAVIWLMEGWQPLRSPPPVTPHTVLAAYYPSGLWTIQAGMATVAGDFDAGRGVNVLVAVAAAGVVLAWLTPDRPRSPFANRPLRAAIAGLLVANPVAVVQVPTAMLDGVVYHLGLILAVSLHRWLSGGGALWGIGTLAGLVVLINAKLAGLVFALVIAAVLVLVPVIRAGRAALGTCVRRLARPVLLLGVVGLTAVLGLGYRPYVTNVLEHGRLVHPPTHVVMAGQAPTTAADRGHAGELAHLVFSANAPVPPGGTSRLIFPWQMPSEAFHLAVDNRSGGFGPGFDITLLLACASLAVALAGRRRLGGSGLNDADWLHLALAMTACVVLFPIPWWARFVPMAWAVPIALGGAGWNRGGTVAKGLAAAACVTACVDAAVAFASTGERIAQTRSIHAIAQSLASCPQPLRISRGRLWSPDHDLRHMSHLVWQRWLRAHGVRSVVVPRDGCPPGPALGADVHVCGRCPATTSR